LTSRGLDFHLHASEPDSHVYRRIQGEPRDAAPQQVVHARLRDRAAPGGYEQAAPDPLANAAPGILAHMNTVDAMILLARAHAGFEATEATMTSADRLGFSLKLKTTNGIKGARINFLREVAAPQDTRAVLVEMVRHAKA